jgi:DNA-binding transcriptional LysR family regulator
MSNSPEWGDLRYFLELARSGKLSATARKLGVEHTTVSRRITRLEQDLDISLFQRKGKGYLLSKAGEALMPHAEAMDAAMLTALSEAGAKDGGVSGTVRIGTPEAYGLCIIPRCLNQLYSEHPKLIVELLPLPHFPNLAAREVDILVSLAPPRTGRYVVSRLTDLEYQLHGSAEYLARHPAITSLEDLAEHDFVDYVQDQLMNEGLRYLEQLTPSPRRRFTSTSMLAQRDAVAAGLGLGMLIPYVVEQRPDLIPVLPGKARVSLTLWIAAPTELFKLRRVRAAWDFIREITESDPEQFHFVD